MKHKSIAESAISMLEPSIGKLLSEKAKRTDMHIVVMDPTQKPWEVSFEEAILLEKSLSDKTGWTLPYDEFARAKARQAWRDSSDNVKKHLLGPATLKEGELVHYGSFEYQGVIVAASGVEPWFDVLVSGWVALAIQQLAQDYYQKFKIENPTTPYLA
ncbi:MAG: hypothetical protein QNK24_15845 [Desulfuromusa sp.]|nr:hypothetical protein [Desulfuromusa sp.]